MCDWNMHPAIVLIQQAGMADVKTALAAAEATRTDRTVASAFNLEGKVSKLGEALFGVYKSASGIMKVNGDAASAAGDAAFGARLKAVNMRGIDGLITSAGDKILARFGVANSLADHLCEP